MIGFYLKSLRRLATFFLLLQASVFAFSQQADTIASTPAGARPGLSTPDSPHRFSSQEAAAFSQTPATSSQQFAEEELKAAEEARKLRWRATTVGLGSANVLDTYLSPYNYTGLNLRFHHDSRRLTRWLSSGERVEQLRVSFRTSADIDFSMLDNPAGNVDEYAGGVCYALSWQYACIGRGLHPRFQLEAGPMLTGYIGAIYNERNGNNPAQAKASLTLDAAAHATYRFRMLKRACALHVGASVPLVGLAFSPRYGQSYYEAFVLDQEKQTLVFAHTANMPSLRGNIMLDIQLRRKRQTALRLGYDATLMQSRFHDIRYHSYTHTFMFGLVQTFQHL